ncbi:LuxR C-terminal-related transcriptional regulator [Streptomyces kaempferi]|uniref:LuxR C-terminal-related transcriptional regulator n=1 Tax=Streptomyces kaempferi TaxID=333725 RepID=A0ABW3XKK9_9ACTN
MTAPVQAGPSPSGGGPVPSLTPRLLEVLQLAANGYPNRLIGRQLGTTEDTVKSQMAKILRRLHVDDRAQAVAVGIRLELLSMDQITIPRALVRVGRDAV